MSNGAKLKSVLPKTDIFRHLRKVYTCEGSHKNIRIDGERVELF